MLSAEARTPEERPRGQAFFLSPGLPAEGERSFPSWPPLSTGNVIFLRDRVGEGPSLDGRPELFLGVDVGAVSTNFALLDGEGNLLKEIYVSTQGRPVQVVTEGLRDLREEFGERIRIRGVGTTGSGRELIGELVGADTVQDEITAHKTGSSFISRRFFGQSVATLFDVGGGGDRLLPGGTGGASRDPDQGRVRGDGPLVARSRPHGRAVHRLHGTGSEHLPPPGGLQGRSRRGARLLRGHQLPEPRCPGAKDRGDDLLPGGDRLQRLRRGGLPPCG